MKFFKRKSNSSRRLVLSRNGTNAIIASITLGEDKPRVTACTLHALPQASDHQWSLLDKEVGLAGHKCTLLLSPGEYQLMQAEVPSVPAEEVAQAIGWKIKDMLAYPVQEAVIEHVKIPQDPNGPPGRTPFVYAIAARSALILKYMSDLDSVRAELDVIDIPELAQRNISALLEEPGRCLAMLSFNENGSLLTYTVGGELYHARAFEISAGQLAQADKAAQDHMHERLQLELQRSLDNFERQFSFLSVNKLVLAPVPGQAALEEYLRENLYVPVHSLDLSEVMNLAAVEALENPAFQSRCFLALGAALRPEAV